MKRFKKSRGFTLVEIMIVVLIIGILLAIAVPNFIKSRETSRKQTCISNLKQMDSGKEQWAMENNKTTGDAVAWADLTPAFIKAQPSCPSGGAYTLDTVGTNPACSKAALGHVLP